MGGGDETRRRRGGDGGVDRDDARRRVRHVSVGDVVPEGVDARRREGVRWTFSGGSRWTFERESTDGSVPPARVAVDDRRRRDIRGATVSLANARVFSATAMCGDPGANLLTVNAEGFDLTRGVPSDPRGGPVLTARDHDALEGEPGLTVVHAAAPGVGGAAYASVSGAVAKIARGRGVDSGLEVVLEDLRVAAADVVAAAASKDDPGDEETLPYHASLDVRESAVVLVGVVGGDGEDATLDGGTRPLTLNPNP